MRAGIAGTGDCKMVASRPRLNVSTNVGRPAISMGLKAPVVVWTDDHESTGHDQVYRSSRRRRSSDDIPSRLPEAQEAWHPRCSSPASARCLYWDKVSRRQVRALARCRRRIAGGSTLVGAGRGGMFWPSIEKMPRASSSSGRTTATGRRRPVRALNAELEPTGPDSSDGLRPSARREDGDVRVPTVAVAGNAVLVTYKLERDVTHP